MIEVTFTPKEYKLEVNGHAEYAEQGKDIVCSACSILFYTLCESLEQSGMSNKTDISMMNGMGNIKCVPKKEYEANVSLIYWTVLNGFQLLSDNYPDNVKISVVG